MYTYSLYNVLNEQVHSISNEFKFKVASFLGITEEELEELVLNSLRIVSACGEIGHVIGAFFGDTGKSFGRLVGEGIGLIVSVGYVAYKVVFNLNSDGILEAVSSPV